MRCFASSALLVARLAIWSVPHPVTHDDAFRDFEFVLARDLSMTRATLRRTMGQHEFMEWMAFRVRENRAREEAMKEARKGRKR